MKFMKLINTKSLLFIYFLFQCFMTLVNLWLFAVISFLCITLDIHLLLKYTLTIILGIIFQIYFLVTLISTITTWKYINHREITLLEKLSKTAFPIITICVYSIIIFGVIFLINY